MKKLMISTIILLPLIILAILLVSGAIKALTTHIYVDRVEFVDDDTLVLVMDDEENPPAEQLEVNVLPLKAKNRDLIFSMDDESIATVDASGRVVAKFYGETYINVMSAEDNLKKDRRRVLVTDDAVHKIEITEDCPTDMYEANTKQLAAVIYPREAKEVGIKWTTSNPGILAISETGIIEARGYGEATITATSVENEEIFDSVTIKCHSAIDEIKTETGVKRVETALETAQFPKIIQSPLDADVTIAYTSDDPDIATVNEQGQITFFKVGKVTITATATDFGNAQVSTSVEYVSTLHYYRLPLFEKKMYTVDFDEYYDANQNTAIKPLEIPFAAGFEPENTNQKIKNVEYSISSKKVLEFDEGKETFYFVGEMPAGTEDITVTVTAEVYDTETNELTEKTDSFTLTVQRRAQSIAVGYNGTENAQTIVLSDKTLIFGTGSGATAPVIVFPANHTDKLSYALENAEGTATISGDTLTFRKAGTVNVLVSCKYTESSEAHAQSRITVSYAPAIAAEHKKPVTVTPPQDEGQQPAKQQVLLAMENDIKEAGILYFAEPAGHTVTYAADNDIVQVKKEETTGAWTVTPQKGGFATVTITVSPAPAVANAPFSAAGSGDPDGTTVYTVEIYVDKHISAEDLSVAMNGKPAAGPFFGATGASVSYEFTAADTDSAMAGKVLYVTYSGLTAPECGEENSTMASGNIPFPENINSLAVTFGVKYGGKASEFGAEDALPTVMRTLKRNAERITFSYKGTTVSDVTTTGSTLTFKTSKTTVAGEVYVEILPAGHTDTVKYSLTGNNATIDETSGELKFTGSEACTVTVKIQLVGMDGKISVSEEIEVHYTPRGKQDKEVTLPEDDKTELNLLLFMNGTGTDKGKIVYVLPAGAEVQCTPQNDVVSVAEENGEWTITPQKGGFGTVKYKVTGGGTDKEYTINVYVNRAVTADNFTVTLQDTPAAEGVYGTTKTAVSFTVTVNCPEGAMAGKQIYVKYNGALQATGAQNSNTLTGTISFSAESSTLPVEFGVQYTPDTSAYEPEKSDDVALSSVMRTLERNAESIAVRYGNVETERIVTHDSALNFREDVQIDVLPENHTDTFAYELEGDGNGIAAVEDGELKFTGSGTVTLIIKTVRNDVETCRETITVTYEPLDGNKEITLDTDTQYVVLKYGSEEGRIYFTVPKDVTNINYTLKNTDSAIDAAQTQLEYGDETSGVYHIVPKNGGFATLTVTVVGGDKDATYTINIYVDAPVSLDDFDVKFNNVIYADGVEFTTSKTSVTYIFSAQTTSVTYKNNSKKGKEVRVAINGADQGSPLSFNPFGKSATFQFDGENTTYTFICTVQYTDAVADYGLHDVVETDNGPARTTRTVITTNGKLNAAPTVTYNGGELKTGDNATALEFEDIGKEITFTVEKETLNPADYQLSTILFEGDKSYVGFSTSGYTFTLTAKKCTQQTQKYQLSIGEQVFNLNITVRAKAQEIQVTCGKTVLGDCQKHQTLLGELTFTVKAGRLDGEPVTNPALEYNDGSDWQPFENGQYTLNGLVVDGDAKSVEFRTTDGSDVNFRLLVERVRLTDFSLEVRIDLGDGNAPIAIGREKSVLDAGGSLQYVLPARMTGTVALYIVADGEYLGGFGTDDVQFKEIIPAQWQSVDWAIEHTLISTGNERLPHANINLVLPSEMSGSASVEIGGGASCVPQCTITFTSGTSLAWIEFPGFDGNNGTDVYKGYQQVRVFAKHSYYKVGETYKTVDYFRIPVSAYADVVAMKDKNKMTDFTGLTWKLTSYTDNAATQAVVVTQMGNIVTYNGVEYTVEGDGDSVVLKKGEEIIVEGGKYKDADVTKHVPWIDPVSEAAEGYIRVYFGAFTGLSESDVQNDLFGNFGEKKGWEKPYKEDPRNIKGDPIIPSAGAYSFLRLEGGDGAVGGVNAHFNFNVIEDPDSDAANNLVNVFDANGYYKYSNIVLQENLYGEGELTGEEKLSAEAEGKGLYLKETGNLGKTLLYGNGYQVNLEAFNASIVADMNSHPSNYPNGYNESSAVTFNRAYNAVIKGSNPKDELSGKIQTTNLHMADAYYCDLSYYYKFNPAGNTFCTKNTVFSCIPKTAVQLYYDNLTMYAENIVMTECGTSIQADNTSQQNIKIYYKGAIDILNYFNQPMLSNMNALVGGFFDEVVPNVINYFEWHGQNIEANASTLSGADKIYVNILAFAASDLNDKVFVWNGNGYGNMGSATLKNGSKIVSKTLVDYMSYHYYAATYETVDANGARLDKATINFANNKFTGKADLNHLFEGDRIRLQCQFKDVGVKNYEHIKWHKQEVYRDKSLLEGRKTHAEDLRDSLKNTQWADGSYVDGGGAVHAAAELTALISEAVIPTKRAY